MKGITELIDPRTARVGTGMVQRVLPWRRRRMLGPFIFADLIGPDSLRPGEGIDIDAHPHVGLSTLTFLLAGRMVHRDSTGAVQIIEPGAVNWMTAGRGVTHTERSHPDDRLVERSVHGLQTWVALPTEVEEADPVFAHTRSEDIPSDDLGPVSIRVIAGDGWAMTSPVAVSSPLVLAEVALGAGGTVAVDATHPERGILAVSGTVTLAGTALRPGQLAVLDQGETPELAGDGRVMLLGGEPVGERFIWWNFVHSDRDRIEDAKRAWSAQQFPRVPGDHDPWVPLPR